jgi:hypothetical protein
MRIAVAAIGLMLMAGSALAQGNLLDQGRQLMQQSTPSGGGGAGLTNSQADSGLREALRVAAQKTIAQVGKSGGYLKDQAIHIPLPGYLESAKKGLGAVGMSATLDDLETRMNHAAEDAASKAYPIFTDAISKMSVSDAKAIVTGPNDAATQYFKRTTSGALTEQFRPIVDKALSESGAMQAYKATESKLAASSPLGGLAGNSGAANFNLTDFTVGKGLDGLFHYIAQQEAEIRTNPAARTTAILKQVFGR